MSLSPLGSKLVAPGYIPANENQDAKLLLGKLVPRKIRELNLTAFCKDITNPYANKAQQSSMEWVRQYGQLGIVQLTEKHFKTVEEYRIGFLLGRAHPHATEKILSIVANFATWLFAYDDIVERFTNKELVQGWHDRTLAIINGDKATTKDDGLMRGLSEIMGRLTPFCSPVWGARISKECRDYTESTLLWEMENRINKRHPDVEEYKEWRPKTSGTRIMFFLKGVETGIELPDEVFERKDFRIVFDAAVEIVNFGNDIISAPKETEDGMHNLVFAYKNEYNLGYEEAINHASRDLRDNLQKFEEMRTKYSGPCKEEVEKFFTGIREWDDANFLWSIKWSENDSDRYIRHWSEKL